MAKATAQFISAQTQQPVVVFAVDMEDRMNRLMQHKDNPIAPAFARLIQHDTPKPLGQCLVGNVFYLAANNSGKDSVGILYIKPIVKTDPLIVVDVMKKGDFVQATQQPRVKARIKELASQVMAKYRSTHMPKTDGKINIPQGFVGYNPLIGLLK